MQKKIKTTWDLSPLFKNPNDPKIKKERKEIERMVFAFEKKWKTNSHYLKKPSLMASALSDYELLMRKLAGGGNETYYFWLASELDQTNTTLKGRAQQGEEFAKKISNQLLFFELSITKIPKKEQKRFLNAKNLSPFHHFLERLFVSGTHTLSEKEEALFTLTSGPSYSNWRRMTSEFLSKEEYELLGDDGKKQMRSFAEIGSLIASPKKKVRDEAAKAFNAILLKYSDIAEWELNSLLEAKKIEDDLRGFSRPDAYRHMDDDMESKVVDALIAAVSSEFRISKRYYALKAKLLGVSNLEYHERGIPYALPEIKIPFSQSVSDVLKTFEKLDPEFLSFFERFLQNGQIDAFPKKGKVSGAFCAHGTITNPTYIMLNHTGRIEDTLTLAHELGHAINNELIRKAQNSLNFSTPLSTAEVASTFMEDFVLKTLEEGSDAETRFGLMVKKLNDDVSTIFRQVACYRFEQSLHAAFRKKGYLSKDEIGKLFREHMAAYMGPAVLQSPGSENWWVYWSHIRSYFYVYSYASGLLISKAMQRMVQKDPKTIEKVKAFLAAGSSASPQDIFKKLGIDISNPRFWREGLKETEALLKKTESLAKKLKKI